MGQRERAQADYRRVLQLPDPWKQGKLAKRFLKQPFTWEDFDREISPHK